MSTSRRHPHPTPALLCPRDGVSTSLCRGTPTPPQVWAETVRLKQSEVEGGGGLPRRTELQSKGSCQGWGPQISHPEPGFMVRGVS